MQNTRGLLSASTFATFTAGGQLMVLVDFQSMDCKLWKIYYHIVLYELVE